MSVAFLFGNQIASTAKAYNSTSISRLSPGSPVDEKPLHNTTILSGHHRTNTPIPGAHSSYSTFAHELAHLFGQDPGVRLRNSLRPNVAGYVSTHSEK